MQTEIRFGLCSSRAPTTTGERSELRIAITKTTGANESLVGRASHDLDGDCRYTAFNCFRVSHRDFLRFHAAVSAKDATLDCCGVDFSLQQDRSRDCGHAARRHDLGDAGNLCRRISVWLLDTASTSGAAYTPSPVSIARLRALACIFTRYLAHLLACFYRFALPGNTFGNIYLFFYAFSH